MKDDQNQGEQLYNVTNLSSVPDMLDDGTEIGAANTRTARREGVRLSALDQKRLAGRMRIEAVESKPSDESQASNDANVSKAAQDSTLSASESQGRPPRRASTARDAERQS